GRSLTWNITSIPYLQIGLITTFCIMDLERFAEFVLKNQHLPLKKMEKKYQELQAIIQSSRTGKFRLIMELAKKRFVIYCCLREISSTGYPPRSRITDLLLPTAIVRKPNRKSSETLYLSYLVFAVKIFNQTVSTKNLTKSEWFNYHTLQTDNNFWEKVGSNMREIQVKLSIMTAVRGCGKLSITQSLYLITASTFS
ncbi:1989_t:CDS:2, partial [Funneliformis caledonium]